MDALRKRKSEDEACKAKEEVRKMTREFCRAWEHLKILDNLVDKAKKEGGCQLYPSGGRLRGWGDLLYLH